MTLDSAGFFLRSTLRVMVLEVKSTSIDIMVANRRRYSSLGSSNRPSTIAESLSPSDSLPPLFVLSRTILMTCPTASIVSIILVSVRLSSALTGWYGAAER